MRLFGIGRKKEEEELAADDEPEQPEEEGAEPEKPGKTRKRGSQSSGAGVANFANFEKLTAKLEALSELRKADSERFSRISEQIGELRNLILEKEEEIKEVGIKAAKAAETVEELKPESILAEAKKGTAKYDVLEAKIEAGNALYQKLMEELKEIRKKMAVFHGMEELMRLNEETSRNLAEIKRTEASIESHANKVGNVYVQFQKQANELIRYHDAVSAMQEGFKKLKSDVEAVKIKAQSALVDQSDLDKLKSELNKGIEQAGNTSLESLQSRISGYPAQKKADEQAADETVRKLRRELESKEKELRSLKSKAGARSTESSGALADFEVEIEELEKAISMHNVNSAITLYNLARSSYTQLATRVDVPEERKARLRNQLLDQYRVLSGLAKEKQSRLKL
ncbi:hypothetical protein HYY73_01465 [Candidatus Woesearchaeota archaeon]|nr:hypothetical protein [Candidatus Woesearchaeota archaeon]